MPLDRWLILRRWQRRAVGGAVLLIVAVLLWRAGWEPWVRAGRPTRIGGTVREVGSDLTLWITPPSGRPWRVRLAGLEHPPAWREPARRWLREAVAGEPVVCVRADGEVSPPARRPPPTIPAYVYTSTGRLINEAMVDDGYATIDPTARHALAAWFAQVRDWASADGRGLWGRSDRSTND